ENVPRLARMLAIRIFFKKVNKGGLGTRERRQFEYLSFGIAPVCRIRIFLQKGFVTFKVAGSSPRLIHQFVVPGSSFSSMTRFRILLKEHIKSLPGIFRRRFLVSYIITQLKCLHPLRREWK